MVLSIDFEYHFINYKTKGYDVMLEETMSIGAHLIMNNYLMI